MGRIDYSVERARLILEQTAKTIKGNETETYIIVEEFPEIDYALIYRGTRNNPWVAAWGLKNINQGKLWSQGHYFATIEGAMRYIQGLKNGIPYCRMEEIASKAIDGLFEDEPYEAEIYCEETLELTDYEREFFGIEEKKEDE